MNSILLNPTGSATHRDALDFSRKLFVEDVRWSEQYGPLQEKFGYTREQCDETYRQMREEITRKIGDAKADPVAFMARRHKATRNRESAPWSVRISAQIELDDLFELVELAKEPGGWSDDRLREAWAFYEYAQDSDTITEAQRHRVQKRQELLLRGPKRYRHTSAAKDRVERDRRYLRSLEPKEPRFADAVAAGMKHLEEHGELPPYDQPHVSIGPNGIEAVNDHTGELTRDLQQAGLLPIPGEDVRSDVGVPPTGGDAAEQVGTGEDNAGPLPRELQPDPNSAVPDKTAADHATCSPVTRRAKKQLDSIRQAALQRMVASRPSSQSSAARLTESQDSDDEVPPAAQPPP